MQHTLPGAPAACCAAVAAAAQQRWAAAQRHGMPQFSACRAGLQPSEPKKNAKAGLLAVEWGQQAWAGWGGAGVAIESGCCRSTGRGALPVN